MVSMTVSKSVGESSSLSASVYCPVAKRYGIGLWSRHSTGSNPVGATKTSSGGIGRRTRLKIASPLRAYGFESHLDDYY